MITTVIIRGFAINNLIIVMIISAFPPLPPPPPPLEACHNPEGAIVPYTPPEKAPFIRLVPYWGFPN